MRKLLLSICAVALLASCAAVTAVKTGQPLNPAQVQTDLETANYLLKTTGCITAQAATVAAPIIAIAGDAAGSQVLSVVDATGASTCKMTVPAAALPVPAPANAAAATAPAPKP